MQIKSLVKKVPLIKPDLPPFDAVEGPFREILENGRVTNFGKYAVQFEQEVGAYLRGATALAISSGTMGLIFALQAAGLKQGQKVVLPSFSFMATAQAILYAGGVPCFADVDETLTLAPQDLERYLDNHPEVFGVVPVHLYGLPCQVEAIQDVVDRAKRKTSRSIALIYDAAHAFGAARNQVRVGNFGDAEVFSLSATKALAAVEGGLVTSRNEELIRQISKMRNYGIEKNYDSYWPGLNGKLSEFHAIIGLENLKRLDENLAVRAKRAAYYTRLIEEKTSFLTLPLPSGVTHTFKDFTVLVPPHLKQKRDAIIDFLSQQEIETRAYFYPPIHEQNYFKRFRDRSLPMTEDFSKRVITLPFFTSISETEMEYVIDQLLQAERNFS